MILMVSKTAGTFATVRGRTPSCNTSDPIEQMLSDQLLPPGPAIRAIRKTLP